VRVSVSIRGRTICSDEAIRGADEIDRPFGGGPFGHDRGDRDDLARRGDRRRDVPGIGEDTGRRVVVAEVGVGDTVFGEHRGALAAGRGLADVAGQQLDHVVVAGPRRGTAEHGGDQMAVVAPKRGDQVEAGGVGVAGLDPVDAFQPVEQPVVVRDGAAAPGEAAGREIAVIGGEAFLQRSAEGDHVACGGNLARIRKTRGIVEDGAAHADPFGGGGHPAGEGILRTADVLGDRHRDVVGRLGHQRADRVFDRDRLSRAEAELGGRLFGGVARDGETAVHRHPPLPEFLEEDEQGHHLGQRGGMARRIGVLGEQNPAGLVVDHVGRIARRRADVVVAAALDLGGGRPMVVPPCRVGLGGRSDSDDHAQQNRGDETNPFRYALVLHCHILEAAARPGRRTPRTIVPAPRLTPILGGPPSHGSSSEGVGSKGVCDVPGTARRMPSARLMKRKGERNLSIVHCKNSA
jgi:hypothetical protein